MLDTIHVFFCLQELLKLMPTNNSGLNNSAHNFIVYFTLFIVNSFRTSESLFSPVFSFQSSSSDASSVSSDVPSSSSSLEQSSLLVLLCLGYII